MRKLYSEKEVTAQIRSVLKLAGIQHRKIWQGPMSDKGISDILGTIPPIGRKLAIEVKKEGWTPPNPINKKAYEHYVRQQNYINEVNAAGGLAFFADSVEIVIDNLGLRSSFIC